MPILTLQRTFREIGRIRIGQQVAASNGRKRPAKLGTFRVTSKQRAVVDAAAELWGGTVTPWDNNGSREFEVITTADTLDIVIPPGDPVSQWFELWTGGGCVRRCDGRKNYISDGPCECPQDPEERMTLAAKGEACKPTTRLSVMLPGLPDLGVLRLETHGYYAAVELLGSAEILAMASARGQLIPARLRLDQREKKVPGKPTNKYAVPVIEFGARLADLGLPVLGSGAAPGLADGGPAPRQLAGGAPAPARPTLPATKPPETSDLRAPTPSDGPQRDADADPHSDTGAGDAAPESPAAASEAQGSAVAAESMDRETFTAIIDRERLDFDAAKRLRLEHWPDEAYQLTDADRATLLGLLRERKAALL